MINNYNKKNDYAQYVAQEDDTLLSWLLANLKESRSKVKATLQGRGIKVNGKQVTQFDFPIQSAVQKRTISSKAAISVSSMKTSTLS